MDGLARIRRLDHLAPAVARVGLGVVILAAGLHKFVAPGAWAVYLAPVFADRWPVALDLTMVVFGATELPVALALLADRWTAIAAGIVAVSMLGTVGNLAIAWAQTGQFADVLIRDAGLFVLASGVTLESVADGET
ncbi:DoxX family protein [Halobacteriales archaeon QS_1_67_19]|nr:MAG: DoxX family protein [Halobacteriales archaeon QS_1_67_19]